MGNLFNSFIDLQNSYNKVMPLAAIWLDHHVQTHSKKTARISKGDIIRVKNGVISDVNKEHPATHEVLECKGNIASTTLKIEIQDLKTKEISTLNLR